MVLIDTHCHIHEIAANLTPVHEKWFSDGKKRSVEGVINSAKRRGVQKMLLIGTSLADSKLAIEVAAQHPELFVSIGVHPHEAKLHNNHDIKAEFAALATQPKVVAVGEIGLDYFYNHSPKSDQVEMLQFQLSVAKQHNLPVSFHVREAFDDFWPIYKQYNVQGVLHSFTDSLDNMQEAVSLGLKIGVNGIATFAKNPDQRKMYQVIPNDSLLLETDSPFLTPVPFRGKMCEPSHIKNVAEFLAELRGENLEDLAKYTTHNAETLFNI